MRTENHQAIEQNEGQATVPERVKWARANKAECERLLAGLAPSPEHDSPGEAARSRARTADLKRELVRYIEFCDDIIVDAGYDPHGE